MADFTKVIEYMKQLTLKACFGYLTILAIILGILRKPIFLFINSCYAGDVGIVCLFAPYWLDLYLLGLEDLWVFDKTLEDTREVVGGRKYGVYPGYVLILLVSSICWFILHCGLFVIGCQLIYKIFFKQSK